jgi:predicted helicase
MYYVYAILYSNTYRSTFRYSLLTDFPVIPFTATPEYFLEIAEYGKKLIDIHLRSLPNSIPVSYPKSGMHKIKYVKYEAHLDIERIQM